MPGTIQDHVLQVIERYDATIRSNRGPTWDTLTAVSDCDDGMYGAWGEVVECAEEFGWDADRWGIFDDGETRFWNELAVAYEAWRIGLRGQVQLEANYRAWRETT